MTNPASPDACCWLWGKDDLSRRTISVTSLTSCLDIACRSFQTGAQGSF
ncbi:hypothetical protein [Raoultella terrigena]